jgi:hypothetical protein
MAPAVARRHQVFHRLAQQLAVAVAEHPFGLGVGKDDAAAGVDDHDGVGHELEQVAVARFHQLGIAQHLEVRDVLHRAQVALKAALGVEDGLGGDAHIDVRTVAPPTHRFLHSQAFAAGLGQGLRDGISLSGRGDQRGQRLADGLRRRVAEDLLGGGRPLRDLAIRQHDHDRVRVLARQEVGECDLHEKAAVVALTAPFPMA